MSLANVLRCSLSPAPGSTPAHPLISRLYRRLIKESPARFYSAKRESGHTFIWKSPSCQRKVSRKSALGIRFTAWIIHARLARLTIRLSSRFKIRHLSWRHVSERRFSCGGKSEQKGKQTLGNVNRFQIWSGLSAVYARVIMNAEWFIRALAGSTSRREVEEALKALQATWVLFLTVPFRRDVSSW